jgi:glyoxylase-like metal-dependent hydrolase (beta-lactamase superfamily II)
MDPTLTPFFHAATSTWSWVLADPASRAAAIIDPALDFDPASGRIATWLADAIVAHVHEHALDVRWILETHAHADHLSAAHYLQQQIGGRIGIGAGIVAVQRHFREVFALGDPAAEDGRPFDQLFADDDHLAIGALDVRVMATPGHTADGVTYVVGDAAFIGDTLFAPDVGSARCDFPGADAGVLWDSMQRILALPDATRLCLAHDYPPTGREPRASVSVAEMRARNQHIAGVSRDDYIALRRSRDAGLPVPRLLYPALQVNIRAGRLPPAEPNRTAYLKVPLSGGW